MFNKEALNEIHDTLYNLIEPTIGENVRFVIGYHNQSTIHVDFIRSGLPGTNQQAGLETPSVKPYIFAHVTYMDGLIGKIVIPQAETISEMKALFKETFERDWIILQDAMLNNYIKRLGLANNICSAFTNMKDVTVEGMSGVKLDLQFTHPFDGSQENDIYFDATISADNKVVFILYDKFNALNTPPTAAAIATKMASHIKAAFLKA